MMRQDLPHSRCRRRSPGRGTSGARPSAETVKRSAPMLGRRGAHGQPQARPRRWRARPPRRRPERSAPRCSIAGSIATTVSSSSLPTQSDPPAAASALGALSDRDRRLDVTGRGLEAGDRAVEMVGDPDRAERRHDRRRSAADLRGEDDAHSLRVDSRDGVRRDRDPHPVGRERHAGRQAGEGDLDDLLGGRIDPQEGAADRVRDPQDAVADRDPGRGRADVQSLALLVRVGIDPAHGAVPRVRDPHRPLADRDARGGVPDPDRVRDRAGRRAPGGTRPRGRAGRPRGFRIRSRSRRDAGRARR